MTVCAVPSTILCVGIGASVTMLSHISKNLAVKLVLRLKMLKKKKIIKVSMKGLTLLEL